jgi:hypothetical protein
MKITHIQVRRFVSNLYFSTKSLSNSKDLRQRETSVWMPCWYHSLSCSCSQVLIALITSSSVLNFTPRTAFFRAQKWWKSKGARSGLSNQILLWLPKPSNLGVVLHSHAEATLNLNRGNFKGVPLKISCF